jgi:hypothetical protein
MAEPVSGMVAGVVSSARTTVAPASADKKQINANEDTSRGNRIMMLASENMLDRISNG